MKSLYGRVIKATDKEEDLVITTIAIERAIFKVILDYSEKIFYLFTLV